MKQNIDFERWNPSRRPDWRNDRVLEMVDRMPNPGRSTARDDEYVKHFRNFLLRYRAYDVDARKRMGYENPGLYWAYEIYAGRQQPHTKRNSAAVEAMLLAGLSDDEIAKECHTVPQVIKYYEALFFNVRDRLQSGHWIVTHALMPAYEMAIAAGHQVLDANGAPNFQRTPLSEPFDDATLKMFGYFGGPIILRYMLDCGFRRGAMAQGTDGIPAWFDGHVFTRLRHRSSMAAQTFELSKYDVMQLFEIHLRIVEIEKSTDSDETKQNAIFSNIAAMLKNMPWAIGEEGKKMIEGTLVEPYDASAAELRDAELQLLSSGRKPSTIKGIEHMKLPPPRLNDGQEDQKHADAQQGR